MAMRVYASKFEAELLDRLSAGRDPKTVLDSNGLLGELKAALAERMLNAEMDAHLGRTDEQAVGNRRNSSRPKTVLTPQGEVTLSKLANNKSYDVRISTIERLCGYFGCGVGDLVEYVPDPPKSRRVPK